MQGKLEERCGSFYLADQLSILIFYAATLATDNAAVQLDDQTLRYESYDSLQ